MSVDQVLADLREELSALFGAGLATPGPGRSEALRSLAETMLAAGAIQTADELKQIADELDAVVEGRADRERLGALYDRVQRIVVWEGQFRRAWALRRCRVTLASDANDADATRRRPPGLDGTLIPAGITAIDGRILFVARLEGPGDSVVLHDEWPGARGPDPLRTLQPSRLFQEPVVPLEVLKKKWRLEDHPAVRRGDRWVAGPSFFSRPRVLDEGVTRGPLPDTLHVGWSSDGFVVSRDAQDEPIEIVDNPVLDFNLRKWRVFGDTVDVRLADSGDRRAIVAMADDLGDICFPTVDPAAIRWPLGYVAALARRFEHPGIQALVGVLIGEPEPPTLLDTLGEAVVALRLGRLGEMPAGADEAELVRAAAGLASPELVERLALATLPSEPRAEHIVRRALHTNDPAARQRFVQAHVTAMARAIRRGGVVPPGRDLWLLDLLGRRHAVDAEATSLVDLGRLRLAAVSPLVRGLLGAPVSVRELEDALILVVGWEDGPRFVR